MTEGFWNHFTKAEIEAIRAAARGEAGPEAEQEAERQAAEPRWRNTFFAKLKRFGRHVPFAEDLVAAYFCTIDPETPSRVKLVLFGALAYFILPFDGIADFLPLIGLADDAAVLAAAIAQVAGSITERHRKQAREVLSTES
jgi:uncharacterized membrane protein YkvA (DUF1232 family)